MFLKKRGPGEPAGHVDPSWLEVSPLAIEGVEVPINRYFLDPPRDGARAPGAGKDRLYGGEQGFSVASTGPLEDALRAAVGRLPELEPRGRPRPRPGSEAPAFTPPPLERHVTEGSFFIGDDRTIYQIVDGRAEPVTYGGTLLKTNGTMTGKRLASLIRIRDAARLVLQSQNDGWPEPTATRPAGS